MLCLLMVGLPLQEALYLRRSDHLDARMSGLITTHYPFITLED
jgi:hypothetical protein